MTEAFLRPELVKELKKSMNLDRLAKTGLFKKLIVSEDYQELEAEIRLHRAVLDKALVDSFSEFDHVRKEVENWLDMDNKDFTDACDRALIPAKTVYKIFSAIREILNGKRAKFRPFGKKKKKKSNVKS